MKSTIMNRFSQAFNGLTTKTKDLNNSLDQFVKTNKPSTSLRSEEEKRTTSFIINDEERDFNNFDHDEQNVLLRDDKEPEKEINSVSHRMINQETEVFEDVIKEEEDGEGEDTECLTRGEEEISIIGDIEICSSGKKRMDNEIIIKEEDESLENEKVDINRLSKMFGPDSIAKMNNKKWSIRRSAVEGVRIMVEGSASRMSAGPATTVRAKEQEFYQMACLFSKRMMKDSVSPVFYSVCELLDSLLERHTDYVTIDEHITSSLSNLVPPLLRRMCETNKRTQREAATLLLKLASNDKLGGLNIVASYLLVPGPNAIRPRLNLLRLLLPRVQLKNNNPLNLGGILGVAVPALGIAEDKTRRAAISLTVECYSMARKRVNRHLRGVKPAMLRILHTRFSEIEEEESVGCEKVKVNGAEGDFDCLSNRPHSVTGLPGKASKLPPLKTAGLGSGRRVSSAGASRLDNPLNDLLNAFPSPLSTPTSTSSCSTTGDILCRSTYDSGDGLLGFGTRSINKIANSLISNNQESSLAYKVGAGNIQVSDESYMDSILANEF